MKSQENRQNDNRLKHAKALNKVSIEKREKLFMYLKRGRNQYGGSYGK
jgi:hypothetical protein